MTKRSYMEAVMEGVRAVSTVDVVFPHNNVDAGSHIISVPVNDMCNGTTRKKIYVRLLLSIDRRESTAAAMETVCLDTWSVTILLSYVVTGGFLTVFFTSYRLSLLWK